MSRGGRKRSWKERQVSHHQGCLVQGWRFGALVRPIYTLETLKPGCSQNGVWGRSRWWYGLWMVRWEASWLCSPCTRPGCWLRKRVGLTCLAACLEVEFIGSEGRAPFDDLSTGRRHKNAKYAGPGVPCCQGGKEVRGSWIQAVPGRGKLHSFLVGRADGEDSNLWLSCAFILLSIYSGTSEGREKFWKKSLFLFFLTFPVYLDRRLQLWL